MDMSSIPGCGIGGREKVKPANKEYKCAIYEVGEKNSYIKRQ